MTRRDPKLLAAADGVCISLLARRASQIDLGYDAAHDDEHLDGAIVTNIEWGVAARLSKAAACQNADDPVRREHLIVAASLLVAEVERMTGRASTCWLRKTAQAKKLSAKTATHGQIIKPTTPSATLRRRTASHDRARQHPANRPL